MLPQDVLMVSQLSRLLRLLCSHRPMSQRHNATIHSFNVPERDHHLGRYTSMVKTKDATGNGKVEQLLVDRAPATIYMLGSIWAKQANVL